MPERFRANLSNAWRLVAQSLSGRLLLLTLLFVMVGEVLTFAPSIGRYYRSLLDVHIDSAEIAILPFTEQVGQGLSPGLRRQLLERAGAAAVMLKRPSRRELFLPDAVPSHIDVAIDLRGANVFDEIAAALDCIFEGGARTLRIIEKTRISRAETIEVIVSEAPIRHDLVIYAERTFIFALVISLISAVLVFYSLYFFLVRPMRRITAAMIAFRENPEDASRIISASRRKDEVGTAERELAGMQRDLYGFIQQRGRLAALGVAVAKIQHDLKNILSSAQIASDRLAKIEDPVVQRITPRLIAALDRAVSLATNTLRYGRAEEHAPSRRRLKLATIAEEAAMSAVANINDETGIKVTIDIAPALEIDADPDQLFRILLNLVKNAAEAVSARGAGAITIGATRTGKRVRIALSDNGPGIGEQIRARLFQPFAGTGKATGSGLGLAIARDLARAHGGDIVLVSTGPEGTRFAIEIPDSEEL